MAGAPGLGLWHRKQVPTFLPGVSGVLRADLMLEVQAPPLTGQDTSASVPVQAWGPSWEPGRVRAPIPATWPRVHLGLVLYQVACEVLFCPAQEWRSPSSSGWAGVSSSRERQGAVVPRSLHLVLLATECASGSRGSRPSRGQIPLPGVKLTAWDRRRSCHCLSTGTWPSSLRPSPPDSCRSDRPCSRERS